MVSNMSVMTLIEEGKIKRYFCSKYKINTPGCVSHITQRAVGADILFLEDEDYLRFIDILRDVSSNFSFDIFAFALMRNHIHLLMRQNEDNLSNGMKILFMSYAKYFNKKYERKGHVFCSRFRQAVCLDDAYLLASSLYIHLNPVRAKMVSNVNEYRWTSWRLYSDKSDMKSFVCSKYILSLLDKNIVKASVVYKEMIQCAIGNENADVLEAKKEINKIKTFLVRKFPVFKKKILNGEFLKEEKILNDFNNIKKKRDSESKEKKIYIIKQLQSRSYSVREIAEKLEISHQNIYKLLKSIK